MACNNGLFFFAAFMMSDLWLFTAFLSRSFRSFIAVGRKTGDEKKHVLIISPSLQLLQHATSLFRLLLSILVTCEQVTWVVIFSMNASTGYQLKTTNEAS